jgi:dihydrofolate reductase
MSLFAPTVVIHDRTVREEIDVRKVVLYQLLSLDGVAEEPGDWMFDGGREVFDHLASVIERQDAVLLGRGTYDYWVGYWPTSDVEPFANFVNGTTKHVFTSTKPAQPWANTEIVSSPAEEYVAVLKQQPGGDIGIHGSIRLTQSLLRAGLVDELRLVVSPVLANNGGRRLFQGDDTLRKLELLDIGSSPAGTVFLAYGRPTSDA